MYLKWTAPCCGETIISIDGRGHCLDKCSCGKSYCDYETYGIRWGGNLICELLQKKQFKTEKIDYDFFDEILICMKEQGFEIPIATIPDLSGFGPFSYHDYSFVRELEDKLIDDLK
jgi:hypothetical protein